MHDPEVLAWNIRLPWPRRGRGGLGPQEGWHRGSLALIDIWHVEPKGHDSGTICKHWVKGRHSSRWRYHVHHWKVRIQALQKIKRRLWTRCAGCGQAFRRHQGVFSTSWDGAGPRWFKGETNVYHDHCHSLLHLRAQRSEDDETILALLQEVGYHAGLDTEEVIEALWARDRIGPGGDEWNRRFRRKLRLEKLSSSESS